MLVSLFAVFAIAFFVALRINRASKHITDQYAGLQASDMLIYYMRTHHGAWPEQWEDLQEAYDAVAAGGENYCTFNVVKKRVWINFGLTIEDLKQVAQDREAAQHIFLRLQSGESAVWSDIDLNTSIETYITKCASLGIFDTPDSKKAPPQHQIANEDSDKQ